MPTVAVHQTAAGTDDRITRKKDLQLRKRRRSSSDSDSDADVAAPAATLTIDRSARLQSLVGFGGAITEASVTVLAKLPDSEVQKVIDAYYSESGNRYSLGRLHINSCDFSVDSWSFDNSTDDFALQHFDTALTHEQQYLLPFLGRVLKDSYHDLQLFASPWSPPASVQCEHGTLRRHAEPTWRLAMAHVSRRSLSSLLLLLLLPLFFFLPTAG